MALVIADRIRETTTISGTGPIYLGGTVTGFRTFSSVMANGDSTFYAIVATAGGAWEVGIGTYSTSSNSLSRDVVLSSSNGGSLVNFTSGTKTVVLTQPSERALYVDGTNVVASNGATIANSLLANSSLTINGTTISLGGSATVPAATAYPLTIGTGLNGTSYNGSAAVTISINSTVATLTGTQILTNKTLTAPILTDSASAGTTVTANSAYDALKVTQTGAGNSFVVEDATSPDPSPFVITANGSVVTGYTTTVNAGGAVNPKLEVLGTTDSLSTIAAGRWSADVNPSSYYLMKSRNGTIGGNTVLQLNDDIGQIVSVGDDGTTFIEGSSVTTSVDGTPGTSAMPSRYSIATTRGGLFTISTVVRSVNIVTLTATAPINAVAGDIILVAGVADTGFNGTFTVSTVAGAVITYAQTAANASSSGGTVTVQVTASTENVRVDSWGRVGIGSTSLTGYAVRLGATVGGATTSYGLYSGNTHDATSTTAVNNITSQPNTAAATFTVTSLRYFYATKGTFGVGSTVTNQYGFAVANTLTGATNNYAFHGALAIATGTYNLYMAGTADNFFGGKLTIADTTRTAVAAFSTTSPTNFYSGNATVTDGATAASTTVTNAPVNSFDNPAIAATNTAVTYTNAMTLYVDGAPTAGTNVTITNPYAVYVTSGASYFGGSITTNTTAYVTTTAGIGTAPTTSNVLELGAGSSTVAPLKFNASANLLATPVAGTFEYDGNAWYSTDDVTGGRGFIPSVHYFRLSADGAAAGPTIANYFGATSGVNLDTSIYYEVEANLYFLKTTAGTLTFTLTFSNAPVFCDANYVGTPVGGVGTVGAPQTAALSKSTAAASALPVTGSLTTAVDHQYTIKAIFQANATSGGTFNLQITSSAGTVTPRTGSYYKLTRLPSANSGAFA